MKKIIFTLLVITFGLILSSCISKRIIQQVEVRNESGELVRIISEEKGNGITLEKDKTITINISDINVIKIAFAGSNQFYNYDLNDLDIKASIDKKKSGKSILGEVRWVYLCKINQDKTLTFNSNPENKNSDKFVLNPKD
jgi:hypothetical protein